jgi:hypothetical protein
VIESGYVSTGVQGPDQVTADEARTAGHENTGIGESVSQRSHGYHCDPSPFDITAVGRMSRLFRVSLALSERTIILTSRRDRSVHPVSVSDDRFDEAASDDSLVSDTHSGATFSVDGTTLIRDVATNNSQLNQ